MVVFGQVPSPGSLASQEKIRHKWTTLLTWIDTTQLGPLTLITVKLNGSRFRVYINFSHLLNCDDKIRSCYQVGFSNCSSNLMYPSLLTCLHQVLFYFNSLLWEFFKPVGKNPKQIIIVFKFCPLFHHKIVTLVFLFPPLSSSLFIF